MSQIVPVILCGGSGTRLWPASRESMPKQFIRLTGDLSTFQLAAMRVTGEGFGKPVVILHNSHRFLAAEQLVQSGIAADILLEPQGRDSAAAVAAASVFVAKRDPDAVILVLPADHIVGEDGSFRTDCLEAAAAAADGLVMTLGIAPDHPATGYGYIKPGSPIGTGRARRIEQFVEKPDAALAARYVEAGYLWNGGYFLFRPDVMIRELERYAPEILHQARCAVEEARTDLDFVRLDEEAFKQAPKISIDYAVMEKTEHAGVLATSFPWSDIGTWSALWGISDQDRDGNVMVGQVEMLGTTNSYVRSESVLTAVVGLDNVVVVTQPDAVLVLSRDRSDEVKQLVANLRTKKRSEADEHLKTYRPWGWYMRIDIGTRFQVKRIGVHPGGTLSLQKHFHRAEHWVVVSGTAQVTIDDREIFLHENEGTYLPIGCTHRLHNPGRIPLEIIEVQVGSYTGEDDIVRIQDVYGR